MDNGELQYQLYDKRDDFSFSIVRLPFLSSNIPSSMFYSSVSAEVLRIGRVSSSFSNFKLAVDPLITRVKRQGANVNRLVKSLKKMYGRHEVLHQYGKNATEFCETCLG